MIKMPETIDDLPTLPVRVKPDWQGVQANLVGFLIYVGQKLPAWRIFNAPRTLATRAMYRFIQMIGGVIYAPPGKPPGDSIKAHEALHAWHQENLKFYRLRYIFLRSHRRHFEAAAYALEVAKFGRDRKNAAKSLADPIYANGFKDWREAAELVDGNVLNILEAHRQPV